MKRIVSLLLVLLMMLTLTNAALAEATIAEAPPAKKGETVVSLWSIAWGGVDNDWMKALIHKWNNDPDREFYIDLVLVPESAWDERIKAARAAEEAPDILVAHYAEVANYFMDGYTQDMRNLVPQDAWDDLFDSARGFVSVGDAYAAYPWRLEPSCVMYYDKAAFAEVGLDPETPPTTWDELIEYAKLLTNENRFGMDIDLAYNFWGWTYTCNGRHLLSDDWSHATLKSEGMYELAKFYRSIRNDGYASKTPLKDQNNGVRAVLEGRAAISFSGSWGIGVINNEYPQLASQIGVAPAPTIDGGVYHGTSGGWALAIDAKAKHPTEAGKVIYFLLGGDIENCADYFIRKGFSVFSTRKSVSDYLVANTDAAKDEKIVTVMNEISPYCVAEPTYPWEITQYMLNMFGSIALEGADIDKAFDDCEKLINQYCIDFNLPEKSPNK